MRRQYSAPPRTSYRSSNRCFFGALKNPADQIELRRWTGVSEQVALHLIAAHRAQQFELLFRLNPFGGGRDIEPSAHLGDGANDDAAIGATWHFRYKGPVNLDLVELEFCAGTCSTGTRFASKAFQCVEIEASETDSG